MELRALAERLRESREHREVSVKLDARKPTDAERSESVVMLQAAERALEGCATTVEVAEALRTAGDHSGNTAPVWSDRKDQLTPPDLERSDRVAAAKLALGVDALGVVALVHRARLRAKAASVERVKERGNALGLMPPRRLNAPGEGKPRAGANGEVELVPVEAS